MKKLNLIKFSVFFLPAIMIVVICGLFSGVLFLGLLKSRSLDTEPESTATEQKTEDNKNNSDKNSEKDSGKKERVYTYSVNPDGKSCTLITYSGDEANLIVPTEIDGSNVTAIGKNIFNSNQELKTAVIPDSVTVIDDNAFKNCNKLISVSLPASLSYMGEFVFSSCDVLSAVKLTSVPEHFGKYSFMNCLSLSSAELPDGLSEIPEGTFYGCTALENITIPPSTVVFENNAFSGSGLTAVTIPEKTVKIGDDCFSSCAELKSAVLPDKVAEIGVNAFKDCKTLTDVKLPSGISSIPGGMFSGCSSLAKIKIPVSVSEIGEEAFNPCGSLKEVYFEGSASGWNNIKIGKENSSLTGASFDFGLYSFSTSNIKHIFTHCLISYPEIGAGENGHFDDDCLTPDEFRRILEQVYENGYVLIDINSIYDLVDDGGTVKAKLKNEIEIPNGKKGLVISIDNVAYDPYEHGSGRSDGLAVIDNKIMTFTKGSDGSITYSDDNEVFPILEGFIKEHPDFSYKGAKCVLAPTGYCGVLGFRTDSKYENYQAEREKAMTVINWFKQNGYVFASHSYYHNSVAKVSVEKLKTDLEKWHDEVEPLIGKTIIYIYPYGSYGSYYSEQHQMLLNAGYIMFCSTSLYGSITEGFPGAGDVGNIFWDRITLAGITLRNYAGSRFFNGLIDAYTVYDNEHRFKKLTKE